MNSWYYWKTCGCCSVLVCHCHKCFFLLIWIIWLYSVFRIKENSCFILLLLAHHAKHSCCIFPSHSTATDILAVVYCGLLLFLNGSILFLNGSTWFVFMCMVVYWLNYISCLLMSLLSVQEICNKKWCEQIYVTVTCIS